MMAIVIVVGVAQHRRRHRHAGPDGLRAAQQQRLRQHAGHGAILRAQQRAHGAAQGAQVQRAAHAAPFQFERAGMRAQQCGRIDRQVIAGQRPACECKAILRGRAGVGRKAERADRQPAAEQPGDDEHTAAQAQPVVPALPAFVRRHAPARVAALHAQPLDAQHHAGHGQQQCDAGRRHHGQAPCFVLLAQRRDVDPVDDGANPVPGALAAYRVAHQFAGAARDVHHAANVIVGRDAQQRLVHAHRAERPLVHVDGFERQRTRIRRRAARTARRDLLVDHEHCAIVGPHRVPGAVMAKMPGRAARHRVQAHRIGHALQCRLAPRRIRAHLDPRRIERRKPRAALRLGQLGIRDIHHHDARAKPQQHQQADTDPKPAMPQVQLALHRSHRNPDQ